MIQQIIIFTLTLLSLLVITYHIYIELQFQQFEIANKKYLIEKNRTVYDKNESLQNLIFIRNNLNSLIDYMIEKYPNDNNIIRMKERFKNTVIKEANFNKNEPNSSSYTINKGDLMVICLRTEDGQIVDKNTLLYVGIHELAHIYSSSIDTTSHSKEFWDNMRYLIGEAINAGIYKYIDYKQNPVKYCGIHISSNL